MKSALYVNHVGELGGAEWSLIELLRCAAADGASPSAAVPDGPLSSRLKEAGVALSTIQALRMRRTACPLTLMRQLLAVRRGGNEIEAILDRGRFDMVHANSAIAGLMSAKPCRHRGIPLIWHARDARMPASAVRFLSHRAAAIIAISNFVRQRLIHAGADEKKVSVIYNGIDTSRFTPGSGGSIRAELDVASGSALVLNVGALVPWKRHRHFLRVAELVLNQNPAAQFAVAGSDLFDEHREHVAELHRIAEGPTLAGRVKFLGQRQDLPAILSAADLLIHTAEGEPFGRAVVEAMASGLPVVAFRSGAIPEIVQDGITGLLAEENDVEGMAQAAARLLNDRDEAKKFGEAGRRRAIEQFDVRRCWNEIRAAYESCH